MSAPLPAPSLSHGNRRQEMDPGLMDAILIGCHFCLVFVWTVFTPGPFMLMPPVFSITAVFNWDQPN